MLAWLDCTHWTLSELLLVSRLLRGCCLPSPIPSWCSLPATSFIQYMLSFLQAQAVVRTAHHLLAPAAGHHRRRQPSTALFTRLIIRLFQLVFSAETVFFSHNKSTNSNFQPAEWPLRPQTRHRHTCSRPRRSWRRRPTQLSQPHPHIASPAVVPSPRAARPHLTGLTAMEDGRNRKTILRVKTGISIPYP
jgi:hypothetical protein